MPKSKGNGRKNKNPVARAIASYRSGVKRHKTKQARVRQDAEAVCLSIQKEVDKRRVILQALEKGYIKL